MQFITNGPDIPEELLRAQEEGKVVFFCGAGISYPAGLPGFKDLVQEIYKAVGLERDAVEDEAFSRGQFDATLDLLERRVAGQRLAVRRALAQVLRPNLRKKGATDTHQALLQLARHRDGPLRLVTTNFDRVFERVAKKTKQPHACFAAPMLPIPKNSRWNGLVYLHGLLPAKPDESALHRLVVTSGDFGLAYLTERWAARFVSELFRNYVVCFVGYSINDPVLRYMMDALAADRMLGEITPQAYALGDCQPGQEAVKKVEWEAKGVTPILYIAPSHNHAALHGTLKAWAETYRDGVLGRERIVVSHALAQPSASTQQDDFVGRVLWALSHESGLPAKRFADLNPVPSLAWLEALSDKRFEHSDLPRFGIAAAAQVDDKLRFSLVHRPSPYGLAPWMQLMAAGARDGSLDDVMWQLARWLVRHLNDPALIFWLVRYGSNLHPRFATLVSNEIKRLAGFARAGQVQELDAIVALAPNAVPGPLMQTAWRLLLTGRVKTSRYLDLYGWTGRVKHEGLTATMRMELRQLLAPMIVLRKPFHSKSEADEPPTRLKELIDWELVLASDHVQSALRDVDEANFDSHLPSLLPELQQLLRDALDLLIELGEAEPRSDRSYWDLPSIAPHWQNRGFHDWVVLIELVRDAWLTVREVSQAQASRIALDWFDLPYAAFKRLALFAGSHDGSVEGSQWVSWLSADDGWWLWSTVTQRETMRLLVLQGVNLDGESLAKLEAAVLVGPPPAMFRDGVENARWQYLVDRSVWLRLIKIQQGGAVLGEAASAMLTGLTTAYPNWTLSEHDREEFSSWMSGSGDPDYDETREIEKAPRHRRDLVGWLKRPSQDRSPFFEDTWRETCRSRFFHSLLALCDLSKEGLWQTDRWAVALQVWSEEGRVLRSWKFGASLVQSMPEPILQELVHSMAWWVAEVAKSLRQDISALLLLCKRLLALTFPDEPESEHPVSRAINHPIGHITNALLSLWLGRNPSDGDKLPLDIEPLLTQICDATPAAFRNGRVLLASRAIALFRVDPTWTKTHLLPPMRWKTDAVEAAALWEGFLWSPRLHRGFLFAVRDDFLDCANHYGELKEHAHQYATFVTYAALDIGDGYTPADFRAAIASLPIDGFTTVARALAQAVEGAGEKREEYWVGRVAPFLHDIWPKSANLKSASISDALARASIAAGGKFPEAVAAVLDWLMPIEHPEYVVHRLHQSGMALGFPRDALALLDVLVKDQPWAPTGLLPCLSAITQAEPALGNDSRLQRLTVYARRRSLI